MFQRLVNNLRHAKFNYHSLVLDAACCDLAHYEDVGDQTAIEYGRARVKRLKDRLERKRGT